MNNLKLIKEISKFRQWKALTAHRFMAQKVETKSSKLTKNNDGIDDEPIPFFGSHAASWRAKDTRSGGSDEQLWYQPYVISGSLAIFLLYFCVLRQENDIDAKLDGNLFDHVQGLEEMQLTMNYKYNKENGLDNKQIIQRLKELGIDTNVLEAKLVEAN